MRRMRRDYVQLFRYPTPAQPICQGSSLTFSTACFEPGLACYNAQVDQSRQRDLTEHLLDAWLLVLEERWLESHRKEVS
jgi:hypothetical protein